MMQCLLRSAASVKVIHCGGMVLVGLRGVGDPQI
jgi:hypothetical protein